MLAHGLVGFAYSAALAAFAFHGARLLQPLARAGRARAYTALVWAGGLGLLALNNRLQEYKPSSVAVFEALNATCFGGRAPAWLLHGPLRDAHLPAFNPFVAFRCVPAPATTGNGTSGRGRFRRMTSRPDFPDVPSRARWRSLASGCPGG